MLFHSVMNSDDERTSKKDNRTAIEREVKKYNARKSERYCKKTRN